MTALIEIDTGSGVPPFEQIRTQILGHVAAGALAPGQRLPTVRDLAADLGIAPGTVARAYKELEAAGVVTTRRRHGTVIAERTSAAPAEVAVAAGDLVTRARAAGMADEDVLTLVRGVLAGGAPA